MNSDKLIIEALQKAAISAIGSALPIKAIGRTLTPPANGRYYELVNIANGVATETWDQSATQQGNFRIILHWLPDDQGSYPALISIGEIKSKIPKNTVLNNDGARVVIYSNPTVAGPIENGSELLYTLTLPYRCFLS